MMPNNMLGNLLGIIQSGGNPSGMLNMMSQVNPQIGQAMNMMRGKNAHDLRTMAMNMAKDRGVSVEDVARSLGIQIPSQR